MSDILFKQDNYVFSYRVAGIMIVDGMVLLQRADEEGFAFPGGHVALGETNAETLIREFKEEIDFDISVDGLKWVGEIFFPWDQKQCHQICLYYEVSLQDTSTVVNKDMFVGIESIDGREFELEFHWIPLDDLDKYNVYPDNAAKLVQNYHEGVQHFVYVEQVK